MIFIVFGGWRDAYPPKNNLNHSFNQNMQVGYVQNKASDGVG
jgi:hypothetical protein